MLGGDLLRDVLQISSRAHIVPLIPIVSIFFSIIPIYNSINTPIYYSSFHFLVHYPHITAVLDWLVLLLRCVAHLTLFF